MKNRSILVTILLVSMLVLTLALPAYAATASQTAYVYGFDFDDGVNTTEIAAQEQMYLSNLGYETYCNTSATASFAIGTSPTTGVSRMNSGVVVFNGHAGPGSMQMEHATSGTTYLTAIKSGGSYQKFGDINMNNCKAAIFMGCKTASTARSSTYGVLTEEAVDQGADCSFGWNDSVETDVATEFRERFFYFLRYGYSVSNAAANAASEMPWFDETRDYSIEGTGGTTLTIAKTATSDKNLLSYDEAMALIDNNDYRFVEEMENGTQVYVRYINNIPTTESIDLYPSMGTARKNGVTFSKQDELVAKNISSDKASSTISMATTIFDASNRFNAIGKPESLDVYCKIKDEMKLVRITKQQYITEDQECYYLDVVCTDLTTGNPIDYMDIVKGM